MTRVYGVVERETDDSVLIRLESGVVAWWVLRTDVGERNSEAVRPYVDVRTAAQPPKWAQDSA